ncbi:hypothetical protein KBW71_25345 [Hydrogenophaga aromaticivorans]|uniref:hypothetical protein n=1 Tax=Hydrogenophaga aromaticivorans TaxID=2610898 RepID=UPI001B35FFC6|nr:hypothetical protein [Hydrogenophaga aromaticivorans]MBQ0921773.1 hypothetical protein [Hydrogenophaga aromaticivorans]
MGQALIKSEAATTHSIGTSARILLSLSKQKKQPATPARRSSCGVRVASSFSRWTIQVNIQLGWRKNEEFWFVDALVLVQDSIDFYSADIQTHRQYSDIG